MSTTAPEDPSASNGLGATSTTPPLSKGRSAPSAAVTPTPKTHLKDDAPLKKDVMEIINTLADDGSKSKYL